jgi:hypothetical protein
MDRGESRQKVLLRNGGTQEIKIFDSPDTNVRRDSGQRVRRRGSGGPQSDIASAGRRVTDGAPKCAAAKSKANSATPPKKQADATKSTAMSRPDAGAAKIKGGLPGQPLATLLLERELGRELELARI